MTAISILGGYQSDFSRNCSKEGRTIGDLVAEVAEGTLEECGLAPSAIETIHVGNAFGQLYTGQGHLGAMPSTVVPGFWGTPAMRHEGACASGSLATLCAMAELECGRYDCALVLGAVF
jgi:acetyl-CoA C-acetyltransferase